KVLTIMSTVFIPLTFLAGVYGMNFDPDSSPLNMPELRWFWGYPAFLSVIFAVAGFEIYFFRRRGWLGGTVTPPKPDEKEKR
ncbi:MAG: magnesium transporter, partial [Candidatus Hydrogenedentes bacterium]|nr:magnesium transporter [Candidatus Hydrogenedentota bacterium]